MLLGSQVAKGGKVIIVVTRDHHGICTAFAYFYLSIVMFCSCLFTL
jgi:hypothetical protein